MNKDFWTVTVLRDLAVSLYGGGYRSTDYDDVLTLLEEEENDPRRDDPDYKRPSKAELEAYAASVVVFLSLIEKDEEENKDE